MAYISHVDRSVVCIYPLLRSHVVERPCEENKYLISTSGCSCLKRGVAKIQGGQNTEGGREDPSVPLKDAASFHWAVMRHMGHRCYPDRGD